MAGMLDTGAADRAKKQADIQRKELASRKQKEDLRAAEAESDIARRKSIAGKGGSRASLLATSETGTAGLAKNLGG